jgi:DNA-binding response OmpR family regulator
MNTLFYGQMILANRLQLIFAPEGVNLLYHDDVASISALIEREKLDLAIIEFKMNQAQDMCRRINELISIPIVLIVNEAETNWGSIQGIHADAFIGEKASNLVMLARIKAIYRRSRRLQKAAVG